MQAHTPPPTFNFSLDLGSGECWPKSAPNMTTIASAFLGTGAGFPTELFIPSVLFLDEGHL